MVDIFLFLVLIYIEHLLTNMIRIKLSDYHLFLDKFNLKKSGNSRKTVPANKNNPDNMMSDEKLIDYIEDNSIQEFKDMLDSIYNKNIGLFSDTKFPKNIT